MRNNIFVCRKLRRICYVFVINMEYYKLLFHSLQRDDNSLESINRLDCISYIESTCGRLKIG